ncbi:MAG: hypothetical protein V1716_01405 [Candidatus Uhrbacteria bacterium]
MIDKINNNNLNKKNEDNFYIHPIFSEIESGFRFFLLSIGMLTQKSFQECAVQTWPTLTINATIHFDNYTILSFSSRSVVDQFNEKFNIVDDGKQTKADLNLILQTQAKLMAVYLYETLYRSEYKGLITKKLDNFIYHIRNAAAHNNLIEIKKRIGEPAEWRGKSIDESKEGKLVFNELMNAGDVILLIVDLSAELKLLDQERSPDLKLKNPTPSPQIRQ